MCPRNFDLAPMNNLVVCVDWDKENVTTGGNVQDPWRLSISTVVQRVESNVDFLISCLGFQFLSSSPSSEMKLDVTAISHGDGKDLSYIIL